MRESGGRLNAKERALKEQFQEIFTDVNYDEIEAYCVSLEPENFVRISKQQLGIRRNKNLFLLLKAFRPRFNRIWERRRSRLTAIRKLLRRESPNVEAAIQDILSLCGKPKEGRFDLSAVQIHLLMSSDRKGDLSGWFSQTKNDIKLILECSQRLTPNDRIFLQLVLLHEFFHVCLRSNQGLRDLIFKTSNSHRELFRRFSKAVPADMFFEEMLISSFIPEGYLAHARFGSNIQSTPHYIQKTDNEAQSMINARRFCAYRMRNMAKTYLSERKKIDASYIEAALNELKNGWRSKSTTR
jgi:hypothetical protein